MGHYNIDTPNRCYRCGNFSTKNKDGLWRLAELIRGWVKLRSTSVWVSVADRVLGFVGVEDLFGPRLFGLWPLGSLLDAGSPCDGGSVCGIFRFRWMGTVRVRFSRLLNYIPAPWVTNSRIFDTPTFNSSDIYRAETWLLFSRILLLFAFEKYYFTDYFITETTPTR